MKPILSVKLKNMLKEHSEYVFNLKNININGRKTGCSGYIGNPMTGLVLYVNTEKSVASWLKETMVRYVDVVKWDEDFIKSKFRNSFGTNNVNIFLDRDELVPTIVKMLEKSK